jgi:hypothetical protein
MKPGRFEAAVLTLFLLAGVYQLFIPPLIGIADNGDFERTRIPNGLLRIPEETTDQRFNFFHSKFAIVPKKDFGIYYFHSSTHLFVAVARWLNEHFVNRRIFDIRVLAAVYLTCFLLGIYLVLRASCEWKFKWRCLLAVSLLVMFTDTAYTAYFSSFYSEPTALVALPAIVGCTALLIYRRRAAVISLTGYFIAATVLVTAKPMYVPFAAIFIPFGIYLARLTAFRYRYVLAAALSCGLLALGVWYQSFTPEWLRMKASYIAIFSNLLQDSPDPGADLTALNLKPEWIRYIGSTPYDDDSPAVIDPAFPAEFSKRVRTLTIPKFLLTHPAQLYRVATDIAPQFVITEPDYAGYYEESSGKPALSQPVAVWSSIRAHIFPARLWLLILYFVSGVMALVAGFRRNIREDQRAVLFLYGLLVAYGAITFVVPLFTMASIDTRYSAGFVQALDFSMILAAGMALRQLGLIIQPASMPNE